MMAVVLIAVVNISFAVGVGVLSFIICKIYLCSFTCSLAVFLVVAVVLVVVIVVDVFVAEGVAFLLFVVFIVLCSVLT